MRRWRYWPKPEPPPDGAMYSGRGDELVEVVQVELLSRYRMARWDGATNDMKREAVEAWGELPGDHPHLE